MRTRRRTPGPIRRLLRERSRLVAVLLLAVVALTASGIQNAASVALQQTLDANWRGAYDILVTSTGNVGELSGLLAPNSLSAGSASLTLDDLARIRSVAGIEVAAPIGEVIVPGLKPGAVSITLPRDTIPATSSAQAFRLTLTYTTDDGLGPRYVDRQVSSVFVDDTVRALRAPGPPSADCTFNDLKVDAQKYPDLCRGPAPTIPFVSSTAGGNNWSSVNDTVGDLFVFNLGTAPQTSTRITLVDPVAERALLGNAGDFLAPLIQVAPQTKTTPEQMNAWAASADTAFSRSFLKQKQEIAAAPLGLSAEQLAQLKQLYADNGKTFEVSTEPADGYVPLLVSDSGPAPLSVEVNVEGFGDTTAIAGQDYGYVLPDALKAGSPGTPLGTSTGDVTALLNPFVLQTVTVPWPGTPAATIDRGPSFNSLMISRQATVTGSNYVLARSNGDAKSLTLTTDSFVSPIPSYQKPEMFAVDHKGTEAGHESVYSATTALRVQTGGELAVPVGSFSNQSLNALQSSLSYVPLGAYQSVGSTLVAGSSAAASKAVTMNASVTGVGLVSPNTVAIASINSAAAWGQDAPVSAVRVRVAGIHGYSAAARQKVIDVAKAIHKLGFTATIVAGSSPTDVTVTVDNYAFGVTDPTHKQRVGTLGDVTQAWSELGAASRADLAVSTSSLAILGIALGSTALLLGAVQFASVARRREQAAILRQLGWTRGRIWRWMAAEEIPGAVIVVLAGLAAIGLSRGGALATTIAEIGFVAVLLTSAIAVGLGSRMRRPGVARMSRSAAARRRLQLRGRTVRTFGLRQSVIQAIASSAHFSAIVIVAVASAALTAVFLEGRRVAGSSLLAQFATAQAALPQIVLGLSAISAGIALAVIGRRVDLARRASQWRVMRAMGWTEQDLRRAQRTESGVVSIPAVIVAAAAAWVGASWLETSDPWAVAAAAAIAGVVAATVVLSVRRKASAP